MQPKITVIGSINTDMVVKTSTLPVPGQTVIGDTFFMSAGGKGANQAVAAARMGGDVVMVGNLGLDIFGDSRIQSLLDEGIDCSFISRDRTEASGVALISVDEDGENQIVVAPGTNYTIEPASIDEAFNSVPADSIVLLQLEIPLSIIEQSIDLAKKKNCRVILDPAPAKELPASIISETYLLTPNETEAEILTGVKIDGEESTLMAAQILLAKGAQNVAITLGVNGVYLASNDRQQRIPAQDVKAIDTTAAGDCFNGSLAAALARDLSLTESVEFASRASAIAVTRLGAQDSIPYANEL